MTTYSSVNNFEAFRRLAWDSHNCDTRPKKVLGYERSRRIIWTGMAVQLLTAIAYWLVDVVPAAPFWHNQAAFSTILGKAPRIVAACLICYICGEWVNSVTISKMKFKQKAEVDLLKECDSWSQRLSENWWIQLFSLR